MGRKSHFALCRLSMGLDGKNAAKAVARRAAGETPNLKSNSKRKFMTAWQLMHSRFLFWLSCVSSCNNRPASSPLYPGFCSMHFGHEYQNLVAMIPPRSRQVQRTSTPFLENCNYIILLYLGLEPP